MPSDVEITDDLIKNLLLKQFSLDADSIELIGEGWDNKAYRINKNLIFRFPRRSEAAPLILREISVLPLLQDLPLLVPNPQFLGKPSDSYPYAFYGHGWLQGTTGCSVELTLQEYKQSASMLAKFLRKLHQISIETLPTDLEPYSSRLQVRIMNENLNKRTLDLSSCYDFSSYKQVFTQIVDQAYFYEPSKELSLVHGDLYHRHLVFSDKRELSAIIDWGDVSLSDPISDLGVVYQFFPKEAQEVFWETYGHPSVAAKSYAKFLGFYSAIALLWFGTDRQDQALIRTSFMTLNSLKRS